MNKMNSEKQKDKSRPAGVKKDGFNLLKKEFDEQIKIIDEKKKFLDDLIKKEKLQ
jgi:hypothetical protein